MSSPRFQKTLSHTTRFPYYSQWSTTWKLLVLSQLVTIGFPLLSTSLRQYTTYTLLYQCEIFLRSPPSIVILNAVKDLVSRQHSSQPATRCFASAQHDKLIFDLRFKSPNCCHPERSEGSRFPPTLEPACNEMLRFRSA